MYDDFQAVKDVNIKIRDSEIVTLLGPSGCGKTSILRAIAGFVAPSSGDIILDDENITDVPPQKRDMGMIFQNYALWPHMKVADNVGYGLRLRGIEKEAREKRVRELLDQVQLGDQYEKIPAALSGGQQQRVALARALAVDPKVLLCDEPLSNLDFKLRVELRNEIRDIAKNFGVTVVYVTHDQTEALAISDNIAVINYGVVIQEDNPHEIFNNPSNHFVGRFVGENNLISGKIIKQKDNTTIVELSSGDKILFNNLKDKLSPDTSVKVIIRHDKLIKTNKSNNSLIGSVKHNAFMGNYSQVEVELNNKVIISANISENLLEISKLQKGDEISLQIDSEDVFLFDTEENRIR